LLALKKKKRCGTLDENHTLKSAYKLTAVFATTTAATATAIATATVATTAAAAGGAFFTGTGFIDREVTAVNVLAIQSLDRGFRRFLGFHGDKAEAAGAAAEFVHDQIHAGHGTVGGEKILKLVLSGVVGQVSDVQFRTHDDFTILS
jgi:hypothetical protein